MLWGILVFNILKINKIIIILFFILCRNIIILFYNFVELIFVFKIYFYFCRIDYLLNNIIIMKKRYYGMFLLVFILCLVVYVENKN